MNITIPNANWTTKLIDAIENSADGDVIICHSEAMKKSAERAKARMCAGKAITFTVVEEGAE